MPIVELNLVSSATTHPSGRLGDFGDALLVEFVVNLLALQTTYEIPWQQCTKNQGKLIIIAQIHMESSTDIKQSPNTQ